MSNTDVNQKNAEIDNPDGGPDFYCLGAWNMAGIVTFEHQLATLPSPSADQIQIDGYNITDMDSAGAWILLRFIHQLKNQGKSIAYSGLGGSFCSPEGKGSDRPGGA